MNNSDFPCLNSFVRITLNKDEIILSNLLNGFWIKLSSKLIDCFKVSEFSELEYNLLNEGYSVEEVANLLEVLVKYEFLGKDNLSPVQYPYNAYLNVTNFCNLKCSYCYFGSHPNLDHGLEKTQMFEIVDKLYDGGIKNIVISGGEPLLRPNISELLVYIKGKGFEEITLLTNGTSVSEELARVVSHCVDVVHVSLDGPNEEINSITRGKGNFSRTIAGITKLKLAGVNTLRVIMNVNAHSLDYVTEMKSLCVDLGVEFGSNVFAEVGQGTSQKDLRPNHKKLIDFLVQESESYHCGFDGQLNIMAGDSCGVGTSMVSVDCFGNIFPCHLFHKPELLIGNILNEFSLKEIMDQSPIVSLLRQSSVEKRKCHGCKVEYFCKGGCLASTVAANLDKANPFLEKDPYCEVNSQVLSHQIWHE
jgi:radical SAM protein with 4Fe4S-binding SPASM domain